MRRNESNSCTGCARFSQTCPTVDGSVTDMSDLCAVEIGNEVPINEAKCFIGLNIRVPHSLRRLWSLN